jgi:hypothetical protein
LTSGAIGSGFTTVATAQGGTGQTTYANGELLIGKTDGTLAKATLSGGTGIDITNADGAVTVDVDSTVVTTAQTGTITSTMIADDTIVDADVNASAAIAGTKVSPDFGSQNVVTTGDVQSASINGGPLAGMRNAIINGNFDIWQRGTSFTAEGYGVDRWINVRVGSTCTMSRQAFTLGQTDVPGEPTYFCRMTVSSVAGAANNVRLMQRIEDARTFAGQQVTISFWAKADSNKTIAIESSQIMGTGGSPSADVFAIEPTKKSLSSAWQKITHTFTFPSLSSKTLGSNGNSHVAFQIWFDAGSNFNSRTDSLGHQSGTFDIAQVQIEAGPVATPFERRPIGTELALCQRYYIQENEVNTGGSGSFKSASSVRTQSFNSTHSFPVEMRETPSVALIGTVTYDGSSNLVARNLSNKGFVTTVDTSDPGSYFGRNFTWTAVAEL